MFIFTNVLVVLVNAIIVSASDFPHPLSDEFIDLINTKQTLWKAGRNHPKSTPLNFLKRLFGTNLVKIPYGSTIRTHNADLIDSLPENFDARDKWPYCPSLFEIRDQGHCGSCWAHGAVEAITDRWCIHSNGSQQFHFSVQDVLACAKKSGCYGGRILTAWKFWNTDGIVSGGNYDSYENCRPYEIPRCLHTRKYCPPYPKTPCIKHCQVYYQGSYQKDKRFGQKPYYVSGEDHIMAELYSNGPLEVGFTACPDLHHYKSGVYKTVYNPLNCKSGHAVKLLGWGVDNGTKYWLVANSWNLQWGELGGYFKFLRGENHLNIEYGAMGGMPSYKKLPYRFLF